jgi:hypothetical protein
MRQAGEGEAVKVNLNQPMSEILALLSQYPVSTRVAQRHHHRGPRYRPREAERAAG